MMKHVLLTCLALGLVVTTASTTSAGTRETFDQVMTNAERVYTEARDVHQMLRRKADMAAVVERTSALEGHVRSLKTSIEQIDEASLTLTPSQQEALARARVATSALMAMLANKTSLLADQQQAARQRGLLRAKADAIAKRADIVRKQMTMARG